MFIFRKKRAVTVDLSELKTDMHSHLLPGIDDGSPDTETSIELIRGLKEIGYENLITTPHIISDIYRNDPTTINNALQRLNNDIRPEQDRVPLRAAAEYFLDDQFDNLLEQNFPLLTIKDNLVLVEFSFANPPINIKQKLFNMQIKGYTPVLAHPERYLYFAANKKWFEQLRNAGCLLQINLLSLCHYYGKLPHDLAHTLIKNGFVDLVGTDLHHQRHLEVLRSSPQIIPPLKSLLDSGKLLNPTL